MRPLSRFANSALAIALIHVSAASAQPTAVIRVSTGFISCDQNPPADDALNHCSLRFQHHRLERGTPGVELARSSLLHPAPLTRFVRGDSALLYASRYERDTWRGQFLAVFGTGTVLSRIFINRRVCQDAFCSHERGKVATQVFMGVGAAVAGVGFDYILRGVRAGNRAMWWHNQSFPHRGS